MEISLYAGYETQQSFSVAFKAMFGYSPQELRKKKDFYPLQLKFTVDGKKQLRGDMIVDIKTVKSEKILLVGYTGNTKNGFAVIGECMMKLQAVLSIDCSMFKDTMQPLISKDIQSLVQLIDAQ